MNLKLPWRHLSLIKKFINSGRFLSIGNNRRLIFGNSRDLFKLRSLFLANNFHYATTAAPQQQSIPSSFILLERERRAEIQARWDYVWKMSAQLAKPFSIYVVPDFSFGNDTKILPNSKRRFRLWMRYTIPTSSTNETETTTNSSIDQLINFERDYEGYLKETLMRMKMKLIDLHERSTKGKKKIKKPKIDSTAVQDDSMKNEETVWKFRLLTADGTEMNQDVSNEMAFLTHGRSLVINDQSYSIIYPTAFITKLELDVVPMVGCPVIPSVNVSEDGSIETCQYFWFISDSQSSNPVPSQIQIICDHDEINGAIQIREMKGWILKSQDQIYVPDEDDVNKSICLIVSPRHKDGRFGLPRVWLPPVEKSERSKESFKKGIVVAPPSPMIWTERHRLCADRTANDVFRCVSYNILADLYMNLTVSSDDLYFPYCPKQYQAHAYRYPLLLKEITGYQADIYCLQEVDTRMFRRFLDPYLTGKGWRGNYKRKGGVVNEGATIYYRPEKLELIESNDEIVSDLLSKQDSSGFIDLINVAKQNDRVWNIFLTRPAIVQVSVFKCLTVSNSFLCVANTHLHFKPYHTHIRLLQAAVAYRHLLNLASKIEKQYPNSSVAVIFCGDFNSTPTTGVCEMFENGRLEASHKDWQPKVEQVEDGNESDKDETTESLAVQGIDLSFENRLRNTCPSIEYTTLTHCFRGALDYIFVNDELKVDRITPMPEHELVTKYVGIPSQICPSDHLPVICDLKFISR